MSVGSEIGKTKDAGYQVGARKTIDVPFEEAWAYIFSSEGMEIWLGTVPGGLLEPGMRFETADGTQVKVSVFKLLSHVRLAWQPRNWVQSSRLQLRVYAADQDRTVIAFHQEMLEDQARREEMMEHWHEVIGKLEEALGS